MIQRVVFDTTTVVSALRFPHKSLSWLRIHWRERQCIPLLSSATAAELVRVLRYPKFHLSIDQQRELLADYIPICAKVDVLNACPLTCRDSGDQPFLDLACAGQADVLVSGDQNLLVLRGQTEFLIDSPETYRRRVLGE